MNPLLVPASQLRAVAADVDRSHIAGIEAMLPPAAAVGHISWHRIRNSSPLESWMHDIDMSVLAAMALSHDTTANALAASTERCPQTLLVGLARSPSHIVRNYLASNSSCPPEVLVALAKDG